ncbi:hypothetical protein Acsp04_17840 [Actinomadura sp. NBRC 104425]|nr:hypothetical protein Acsp04_17840 [Actinomadura sp. NBRC 104425]
MDLGAPLPAGGDDGLRAGLRQITGHRPEGAEKGAADQAVKAAAEGGKGAAGSVGSFVPIRLGRRTSPARVIGARTVGAGPFGAARGMEVWRCSSR